MGQIKVNRNTNLTKVGYVFGSIFPFAFCGQSMTNLFGIGAQADPAQALSVRAVPLGALLAAAYPLASRPPYVMSWLNRLITAQDMVHPELMEKFVMNNFCKFTAFFSNGNYISALQSFKGKKL